MEQKQETSKAEQGHSGAAFCRLRTGLLSPMGRETPFLGQQVRMEVQPKASWLPYEAAAVSSLPTGRQVWAFCPCKSRSSPPAAVSSPTVFKVAAGQLSPLRDSHLVHKEHLCMLAGTPFIRPALCSAQRLEGRPLTLGACPPLPVPYPHLGCGRWGFFPGLPAPSSGRSLPQRL